MIGVDTDIDPKLAVHRSNNQNRDATPGQKAMATAMAFPDNTEKGGRGKKAKTVDLITGFDKSLLSRARYVLRNSPMVEGERYPGRYLDKAAKLHLAASLRMGDWLRNWAVKANSSPGNQYTGELDRSTNATGPSAETYTSLGIDKRGSLCNR